MSLGKVTIYHRDFSLSLVCVFLSAGYSLEGFLLLVLFGGPLSTVGLLCVLVCDNAACVACADPFIVLYTLSSSDVRRCGLVSPSEDSLSDK